MTTGSNEPPIPDQLLRALAKAEKGSSDQDEVSRSARRKAALADIEAARAGVRYIGPKRFQSAEEKEQYIADLLYEEKLAKRAKRDQKRI